MRWKSNAILEQAKTQQKLTNKQPLHDPGGASHFTFYVHDWCVTSIEVYEYIYVCAIARRYMKINGKYANKHNKTVETHENTPSSKFIHKFRGSVRGVQAFPPYVSTELVFWNKLKHNEQLTKYKKIHLYTVRRGVPIPPHACHPPCRTPPLLHL